MRRLGAILAGALVLVGLLHAGLWWAVTVRLEARVLAAFDAERASGASLAHGPPSRGGYPFSASVTFPDLRYRGAVALPGGGALPVAGSAATLRLTVAAAAPRVLVADIACPCEAAAGPGLPMPIAAEELRAVLPLARGEGGPVATGRGIVLYLPDGPVTVARLRATAPEAPAATVSAEAFGIVLPPPEAQWPFGREVASAAVTLRLRGLLPPGPSPARALAAWRDQDGALLVDRLSLAWGPLSVNGAASLSVDQALQPRGSGTATLGGFGPAIDRLVAAGLIGRGPAALVRLGLAAASRPGEAGERVVDIALALEDRTLTVGRIPVARLPPVTWPDAAR